MYVHAYIHSQGTRAPSGYPDDIWTVRIWTVRLPGNIWTVKIWTVWTVKTGLGLVFGLGLRLVMTVQILTVHIKAGNHPSGP